MGTRTPLFVRKQSGGMFVITDETDTTGNRWFVDSGSSTAADSAGYGQNPDYPCLTWDYAVGLTTANNGDKIYLMPGHAETLTTAGDVTLDKAGITTIGLGEGADRPTFTFSSTDNTASVLITAASNKIKNIIGVGNDDGMTNAFHVQAADTELDIEWHDTSAAIEAATVILTTAAADRLKIKLKYIGFVAGNAVVSPIQLVGVNDADIYVDFYGIASTSVVDMLTTACTDIKISGYFYVSGTTDLSKNVTANIGGCTWYVNGYDAAAGSAFYGGSGLAVTSGDLATVASDIVVIDSIVDTIKSDLIVADALIDTIKSDLIVTNAIVDTVASDIVILDPIIDTIKSDLIVADALIDTIKSDLIVADALIDTIDTVVDTIASDLIVTDAIADTIKSDLIVADALIDTIKSDLIVADALIDTIKSDLIVIQPSNPQLVSKAFADLTGFDTTTAFTVTGDVMVQVVGVVGVTPIQTTGGASTLAIGTAEATGGIIAATTMDNSQFAATDVWVDTSPANDVEVMSSAAWNIIGGGADIVLTRGGADDVTQGTLTLYCWWKALSAGATVVSA